MPELPEVAIIVKGLKENLTGDIIKSAEFSGAKFRNKVIDFNPLILVGKKIQSIERRAKYILIHLYNKCTLILHLGMSGRILINVRSKYEKHNHLKMIFKSGTELIFNDPRRFGIIKLINKANYLDDALIRNLGCEPLSEEFNFSTMQEICIHRKSNIKSVIMNSKLIVGVGNIYACESLFEAKILPIRPAESLSNSELTNLVASIKQVIRIAIAAGGSTLKDYVDANGKTGEFQSHFKVYGRAGEPCFICNNPVKLIRIAGRSSFYCSGCQK